MKTLLSCFLLLWGSALFAQTSNVKRDQTIVFFPALAHRLPDKKGWELDVRGCVYEFDRRAIALFVLRDALGIDRVKMNAGEKATFNERARLFLADNKGGRRVVVQIGGKKFPMDKSKANGHFSGKVRLTDDEVEKLRSGPVGCQLAFQATTQDGRVFAGVAGLVDTSGLTVISDIDDTIKITDVLERSEMLRRTFLETFEAVPGMADTYQSWAKSAGIEFHYVSASPWQLYLPLSSFVRSNGFPEGTFDLRTFRLKDSSFFSLFESPESYKLQVIEPLLKEFPDRRFVLVGDSGERDPEAYSKLARKYPNQILHIFIRNVTNQDPDATRFQKDFQDLPPTLWSIFNDPSEMPRLLK